MRLRMTRYVLLIIFCTVLNVMSTSAHPQFVFENVTTQDGLSSHDVKCLAQDKYGLMWFGTDEGLNRYDGSRFDVFKHTRADDSGLNSSWINCIYEDSEGDLWIGTEKGVSIFDIETGHLEVLSDKYDTGKWLMTQRVAAFHEDRNRCMWIGTTHGIIRYDRLGHKLEHFTLVNSPNNLLGNEITRIAEDMNEDLWIGTFDGVWKYSQQNKTFEPFCVSLNPSHNNYIEYIYIHPGDSDHIYLGTSLGLLILDLDGNPVKKYDISNSAICDNDVRCIIKYDDNRLLLGTANGLSLFDIKAEEFMTIGTSSDPLVSLPSNYIRDLYEDKSGIIWIATSMGLSKLDRFMKPIEITEMTNEVKEVIHDIKMVGDTHFWLATQKGIMVCDENLQEVRRLGKRNGLTHDIVKRIHTDARGRTWVGTNDGILYYDQRKGSFVKVICEGVTFKYIYDIKEDNQGRIITNIPNGVCIISCSGKAGEELSFKTIDLSRHLSQGNSGITYIDVDSKGTLWIGTMSDGIIRLSADGSFRQYDESVGLSSDRTYCIFADRDDNIWVGTDLGLSFISSETGDVTSFDDDPYFSRSMRTITQDDRGMMWFGTAGHLIEYNPETQERVLCSLHGQLGIRELIHNSVCHKNGNIYMSGNGFVLKFRPEEVSVNKIAPDVVISNLFLTSYVGEGQRKIVRLYVSSGDNVRLNYNQNSFRINFTMPYYMSSDNNSYMYMLENHDKTWNWTNGKTNWANYSNLKSGTYTFLVKGFNSDGVGSNEFTSIDITILPPWWASTLALLMYVVIGALVLFAIFQMVRLRMKFHARLKEERYKSARVEKLNEMKMQFFTNISHEFRTPLSLIQGPVEALLETVKDESQVAQLNLIKQNGERLLDLINQIMDLRKIESGKAVLKLNEVDIVLFTKQLAENFRMKAENKNISYEFESEMESLRMAIDDRKYEKVLFNLISNAIKFTPEGGVITTRLRLVKEQQEDLCQYIEVSVSDTGCGIHAENLDLVFERFYQENGRHVPYESMKGSGIGLVIAKDYVELHGGSISVSSTLGEGSVFVFTIPVGLKADEEIKVATTVHTNESRPKIAVVEDDQDMLHFLRMVLGSSYDVYTATDGRQGLDMINEVFPDIVLTDLMMNEMDGLELCRKVKGNPLTCHIPIVILTAQNTDDTHQQAYELGADSYLTKPFSVKTLQTRLNAILDNRGKLHESYRKQFLTSPSELALNSQEDKFIHQIVKIVEENMSDPEFGVQQLCTSIRYPYQQVYRKVKMITGESLNEFIRNIRLKRAAQYLENTDLRVSEVMYKVGFNSHSYFTKCYKEYFGVPPTEHYSGKNHSDAEKQ